MENLLVLLDKIHQVSPLPVFSQEVIIVQNAGMQHWLNLSLAQSRSISMNINYALPAQYLWKLLRSLATKEDVPDQSPYSREALCWRICQILEDKAVINSDLYQQVTDYWQSANNEEQQALKRYQLACQLADLYEQYLIFRPEWIDAWYKSKPLVQENVVFNDLAKWQGDLWLKITKAMPYNPQEMLEKVINRLKEKEFQLPERISFFGINSLAPMWLSFIDALSEYTQIHFFHLNPCFDYWADIKSEKQALASVNSWTEKVDDFTCMVGNPLLANLGQQGREFLAQLQQFSTIDIDVYQSFYPEDNQSSSATVLQHIQQDILALTDKRDSPITVVDDSIMITSAHSALREVQGLHDWLLHQFNHDPGLTPKDILVMCPQVEEYAPYIQAVFANGWQDISGNIPPLPCSIADRVTKESEPIVAAFSELLVLPDSRFQVSQILSWLRLPAIQAKFSIDKDDIEQFTVWLSNACVHWGLDKAHKQQFVEGEHLSEMFTWRFGFEKLLRGYAFSDQQTIFDDNNLLPDVEGDNSLLLGKLMLLIEHLQFFASQLSIARTPKQWHQFLFSLLDELFELSDDNGFIAITQALDSLVSFTQHGEFEQALPLAIVRDFLNQHFSQPDPGRQFMVGQVTFCSMLPMRSIPFKIIAILGLNDNSYPRQRQPLGFDLMSLSPAKLGDRSRRGDDRYLFLESIVSARQSLYLSYQGKNIKNNATREPSIVLKELMNYLTTAYNWSFEENNSRVRQLPMQAFSWRNYTGEYPSFDKKWLGLLGKSDGCIGGKELSSNQQEQASVFIVLEQADHIITLQQLISFYQHPAKYFARNHLKLNLDDYAIAIEDVEPFKWDNLSSYLLHQELVSHALQAPSLEDNSWADNVITQAKLSGKFPDLPNMEQEYIKWRTDCQSLAQYIIGQGADQVEPFTYTLDMNFTENNETGEAKVVNVTIKGDVNLASDKTVLLRASTPKVKDFFTLYLQQLFVQVALANNPNGVKENALLNIQSSHGYFFDTHRQKVVHYFYPQIEDPEEKLRQLVQYYLKGQQQPLLLNGTIMDEYVKKTARGKEFHQANFENYWQDDNNQYCLANDEYMQFFWPKCPQLGSFIDDLVLIYQPIFDLRQQVKVK